MKAIRVKYLAPTNYRGSRLKASDDCGNSVTLGYDYGLDDYTRALQCAQALCIKMNWPTALIGGGYGDSDYFVFANTRKFRSYGEGWQSVTSQPLL